MERLYDALRIADIQKQFGQEPKLTRDGRSFFLRTLVWELHTAREVRDISPVTSLLIEKALYRLAYEATFLMSMYYMNRVQDLTLTLGFPSMDALYQLNAL